MQDDGAFIWLCTVVIVSQIAVLEFHYDFWLESQVLALMHQNRQMYFAKFFFKTFMQTKVNNFFFFGFALTLVSSRWL